MPATTPLTDPESFYNLVASVELAAAAGLAECEITPETRIIGWSAPPEDCCGLAVWPGDIRHDPAFQVQGMDTAMCATAFLIDIHIRYSECFVDTHEDGSVLPEAEINALSAELYKNVFWCLYLRWWCRWVAGEIEELDGCIPIRQGPISPYAGGGCGGGEFIVTVRVFR